MKKMLMGSLLGVLAVVAMGPVGAEEKQSVTVTGASLKIAPPGQPYKVRKNEFENIAGQYDLQNGKTLKMLMTGRKMYGELDGMPRAELVAAAPNVYVAKNSQMKMTFSQADNGVVTGVTVTYAVPQEVQGQRRTAAPK